MHRLLALLFAFSLAVPCWAADNVKTNTLTPKEIAEGWILLFDGETAFGWDASGKPEVRAGSLIYGGDQDVRACTTSAFRDYELKLEYLVEKAAKDTTPVTLQATIHAKIALPHLSHKRWVSASFEVKDGVISGSIEAGEGAQINTQQYIISKPKLPVTPKCISFEVHKGDKLSLRNVKLKPLETKPLFNGKDLSGWKKFEADPKRAKSQFTATEDGLLSIKNGPGDLQTTGEWSDFVLQLDCRTNGDHLNSGVFFRCIPGEYQNGYEAQIQNQAAKQPKTYTIDEYDPKTHKLVAKKKIENWSQDYGTGAIYRRMPARRAVAKDREWFTMTVAAQGRHIAIWVNGIQVLDWTDNRPENENARNGCRLKKGPISLQGHDPTTDLSFRNIRIADLGDSDPK
jgi:3-keto-disaccharide hydrolase